MIALDTNILAHAHRGDASLHDKAQRLVRGLAEARAPWGICFHSLIEFYGVVTQSRLWRQPSTPDQAMNQINAWRESPSLRILCDSEAHLDILHALGIEAQVTGSLVHDARIAACCLGHGITELWTVDRDFSRFPKLKTSNPLI